ncbi:conserved unknown protein [Ectocarpus siliculosus]|uniref:Uncharacterized protein n=1 Tax=Ectocarpus siliculosus TaxID=2880 RepID=D7FGZ3_ECTSI|nr:conserved unknown protein [Ectocarpus siliculosus]|eukprot:CBJ28371.1 conserved unknown protein [Ectocarpus siliculosus]
MMMCVDELESQRRELEARRAMLEERFKLRLATAQEFGMIHTQRLGRVREAFVAQCGAARRRNQSILDKAKQSNDAFSHERALSGLSHKRLSHQTERFLSVADKLYPAWQEEQLHRKTRQLATIEEERFVTEQRRRAARDRFEQEQALAAVIAEGQRRLAAARAHERNESAVRQVRRGRSTAADGQALNAELERVNEAGRNARYDALAGGSNSARYGALAEEEATRRRRRRGENDPRSSDESSDGGSDDSGDRGEGAGRRGKRCYIGTDDDLDDGDERESCGGSEGGSGSIGKARGGAERAVPASEGVGQAWRDGEVPAGVRKEQRSENEGGGANSHERSRVAEGSTRRGRGRGDVESLETYVLQDVFCARQGEASHKAGRVGYRATGNPESRCGDDTAAAGLGANGAVGGESLQRRSSSSPLTVRKNGRHGSGMPVTATAKPDAERARERRSKTRDSRRRHRRRRSDENEELSVEPPQNLPPPPPKRSDGGCDSGVDEDVDSVHGVASAGGKPSYSTKETAELDLPRPPEKLSPTPGQRGDRARSFSSSDGSGRVMTVSSEGPASKLRDGGGIAGSSRKGARERLSREATAAGNGATGVVIAAARVPSWSEEEKEEEDTNEDNDAGTEGESKKRGSTTASAILSSEAAGFGHAVTSVLGRKDSPRDGRHGEPKVRRTPSKEGYLPTTLATPSRRPCLSLPEAARAVAALTAQIENLSTVLAAAPYGDEPGPSSSLSPSRQVLDAYGSVATVRSDGAKAAAVAAAVAAAAVATPVDDTAASTFPPSELAAFEMADLCAAVLDLITVHSAEILPAEALSGIVTAAKVRAEHRRGGKAHPGRLQLFDAVTSHARRLASGKDLGGVDHSTTAIAGVFAPCFEAAFSSSTARGNRAAGGGGASERLRRKVLAFLESAAGSNGAVDRGATAARKNHSSSKPTPAIPVMAATGLTKNHRGSSGFTKRAEGLPDGRQPKGL